MKILLITFIIFCNILEAKSSYAIKLYEKILPSMIENRPIKVFLDKETKELLKNSELFQIIEVCTEKVDVLIGKNFHDISEECKNKPIFATNYKTYKKNENSIGAFYWRKGRPQIIFNSKNLTYFQMPLVASLRKFQEN